MIGSSDLPTSSTVTKRIHPASPSIEEHVQTIYDALWQRSDTGSARVIVGAGFSKNAEPLSPNARPFPLWNDLAQQIRKGLPGHDISSPLHLAQAYAQQHTLEGLRSLIETEVPDSEHQPGELHRRLVALPWVDIFTTNYDTLLERANEHCTDPYHVVSSPSHIAGKYTRRLVKLHGTVGQPEPLIAKLDDYTGFSASHAPFEALMRQALAESTFVLIGFTGDDPNFEAFWSWVHRCFGASKPRVFWCGLDLDANRRLVLDSLGITPLDLSSIVAGADPNHRHATALGWLFEKLDARPAVEFSWSPRDASAQTHGFTPFSEFPPLDKNLSETKLMEVVAIWRRQRTEYPGWHILPDEVCERIWGVFGIWRDPILQCAEQLKPIDRLLVLHEYYWRADLALVPIFTSEADRFVGWIEAVDPFGGKLRFIEPAFPEPADESRVQEAWLFLAFCVLRTARDDLDNARFALWHSRISSVADESPTVRAELQHELVIHALNRLDLSGFRTELDRWQKIATLPLEFAQLAAYAAERGKLDEAEVLITRAIAASRSPAPSALWLTTWCQTLSRALHWQDNSAARQQCDEALARAKRQGYDPWILIESFRKKFGAATAILRPVVSYRAGFDDGDVRQTIHLGGRVEAWPAFQLLRFIERAPMGIYAGVLSNLGEAAGNAAVQIGEAAPQWTLAVLLRAQAKPETLDEVYDRLSVASCSQTDADRLCARLLALLRVELEHASSFCDQLGKRMTATGLDILSRFSLRQGVPDLNTLIDSWRQWYECHAVVENHELAEPLGLLITRVISALPDEVIPSVVVKLLGIPLYGEDGFQPAVHEQMWPEPFERLRHRPVAPPDGWVIAEETWARLIAFVGASRGLPGWGHAFARLYYLHANKWLTAAQDDSFEEALWTHSNAATRLPVIPGYRARIVLRMRGSATRNAANLLKESQLSRIPKPWSSDGRSIDCNQLSENRVWIEGLVDVFRHEALAEPNQIILPLTANEAARLSHLVLQWYGTVENAISPHADGVHTLAARDLVHIVSAFAALYGESLLFQLPRTYADFGRVDAALTKLRQLGYPLHRLMPGELFLRPATANNQAAHLVHSLLSDDDATTSAGIMAMQRWFRGHHMNLLVEMPTVVHDTAAIRLGLRRGPGLDRIARYFSYVVEEMGAAISQGLLERLLLALVEIADSSEPLLLKQRLSRGEVDRCYTVEHLHLRSWSALLARKLDFVYAARGESRPGILARWQEIRELSVLPEIRRA